MMGTFAVHLAAARLNSSPHVVLRQELIRRLSRFMPPIMLLPVGASIAALTLCGTSVLWILDALGPGTEQHQFTKPSHNQSYDRTSSKGEL